MSVILRLDGRLFIKGMRLREIKDTCEGAHHIFGFTEFSRIIQKSSSWSGWPTHSDCYSVSVEDLNDQFQCEVCLINIVYPTRPAFGVGQE